MNVLLTEKIIKQLCGELAYKKGENYYRSKKVNYETYYAKSPTFEATVNGISMFHVTIQNGQNGSIKAECTCPTLASFNKYCQHIAATLLCIQDLQQQGSTPISNRKRINEQHPNENLAVRLPGISAGERQLANEMLSLFGNKPLPLSGNQRFFETRDVISTEFICKPISLDNGQNLFAVQVKIGSRQLYTIDKLSDFLANIELKKPYEVSTDFTYNPELHCFQKESDAIIRHLSIVNQNEKMYLESSKVVSGYNEGMILIPPSFWESLLPLLRAAPFVLLEHDDLTYKGIQISTKPVPLQFKFDGTDTLGYQLDITGLNEITVMEAYNYVLFEGNVLKLAVDDCRRLVELKQMLDQSGKHQLVIPSDQMEHFVETVIPGLMKLGHVRIAQTISERLGKTPLRAKLFLDRVKNRLLAGLEFQYGNLVINPIEGKEHGHILKREGEKEQQILELLEESSFTKTESGYYMHNEEAEYHFLYHIVPRLRKLVKIYATTAVKLRLHSGFSGPKIRVRHVDERTDWLAFQFDIQGIPEAEIRNLLVSLEVKRKYYRLPNGSFLSLETKEFQKINQFMIEMDVTGEELTGEGIRSPLINGIQLIGSLQEGNVLSMGQSFLKLMENLQHPDMLEFPVPQSLNSVLRDYQKQGFHWLKTLAKYKFGGILADDMGLGKTVQSIAFLVSVLPEIREQKRPSLILTPSSLVYNWLNELKKFAPEIRALIVDGNKVERSALLKDISGVDVIITSYPILRRDITLFDKHPFHTMIMDEAQAFKNHTTQTAKAVRKIQANYRFALSGTPIENAQEELWSIFHVVFPNLLPGRKAFNKLTRENVAKRVRPFILRRLKEDVLKELPEKIESIQSSELLPEQKKLYAAYLAKLKQDTLKHLDKETFQKNRIKILAGLTRLRQLCCHPALFVEGYTGSSAKLDQLLEIIEECRLTGKRVLIFSQFTKMLAIIGREMGSRGLPYFYLDGGTPSSERVELCDRFNDGERDLFLISLKAGGTGLNLTGADTVVLYDLWWNPAVEQQAADRAHRMGQKKVVHVIKLVAHGTIEEKMNVLQERKKNLIGEIIQPGKEKLSAFSEQEIRDILNISR
jgi:superfamily II DNA or RNA helicase